MTLITFTSLHAFTFENKTKIICKDMEEHIIIKETQQNGLSGYEIRLGIQYPTFFYGLPLETLGIRDSFIDPSDKNAPLAGELSFFIPQSDWFPSGIRTKGVTPTYIIGSPSMTETFKNIDVLFTTPLYETKLSLDLGVYSFLIAIQDRDFPGNELKYGVSVKFLRDGVDHGTTFPVFIHRDKEKKCKQPE